MLTTVELLDRIKARYDLPSDYALHKKTGFSRARVSSYRTKRTVLDNKAAFIVAGLLDLNPAYVIACVQLESAERKEDKSSAAFWLRYA